MPSDSSRLNRKAVAALLSAAALVLLCLGCRSTPAEKSAPVDWSADWSEPAPPKLAAKPKEERKKKRRPKREVLDELWRQGYGSNNPNADRLRTGEPTEPFFPPRWTDDEEDDRRNRPHDRQHDPLYNEHLRGLHGTPW